MAKKELNIFNVSFLDLLSGALGAVIILYIIVPKINIPIEEFEEQKKLTEEIQSLGKSLEELKNAVSQELYEEIQKQMEEIIQAKEELEQKVEQIQRQLKECLEGQQANLERIATLEAQVASLQSNKDVDVGFKFGAGKKIVFAIDVSGSMQDDDKIGEVKAGLKMLVSTMDKGFDVDLVVFPIAGQDQGYYSLWGYTKPMNPQNKAQLFKFLYTLSADGGTPVNEVLMGIFRTYSGLSDIVLLCDGEPSHTQPDEILDNVRRVNTQGIRVNTVGVGPEYLQNTSAPKVVFLRDLAAQNNGFFVGF